ncbi:MAG: hypothetical protein FWF81_02010 [Defluviitaleaceae bacterium]|nr:hypothetical protein [Defluviitaleaceae bacterium]
MVKTLGLMILLFFLVSCTGTASTERDPSPSPSFEEEGGVGARISSEAIDDSTLRVYPSEEKANSCDGLSSTESSESLGDTTQCSFTQRNANQFYMKYYFNISQCIDGGTDGFVVNNWWPPHPPWPDDELFYAPATPSTVGSDLGHDVFIANDGRIMVRGSSGWPGPLRNTTHDVDENVEIQVSIRWDHNGWPLDSIMLLSHPNVLSQIPEFWEDDFLHDLRVTSSVETQRILYCERKTSSLWQWLMNEENAWRITVLDPRPFSDIFQDISGDLWSRYGIQIFSFAGDVTIISQQGVISQFPELQEDNLYFDLYFSGGFEMQYIMLHEQTESRLWQLLLGMRG